MRNWIRKVGTVEVRTNEHKWHSKQIQWRWREERGRKIRNMKRKEQSNPGTHLSGQQSVSESFMPAPARKTIAAAINPGGIWPTGIFKSASSER